MRTCDIDLWSPCAFTHRHPPTPHCKTKLIVEGRWYYPSIVSTGRRKAKNLILVLRKGKEGKGVPKQMKGLISNTWRSKEGGRISAPSVASLTSDARESSSNGLEGSHCLADSVFSGDYVQTVQVETWEKREIVTVWPVNGKWEAQARSEVFIFPVCSTRKIE